MQPTTAKSFITSVGSWGGKKRAANRTFKTQGKRVSATKRSEETLRPNNFY